MQWYDEKKDTKDTKISKILKISIIITIIFIIILSVLIISISKNTVKKIATIDGTQDNKIFDLFEYEKMDNDEIKVWIPIKEIAPYLGYKAYNGNYNSATEDTTKCYVSIDAQEKNIKEVANFQLDSNKISKLDLTIQNSEYEFCQIEDKVIEKDNKLFTTIEGIEKAFNVSFDYDLQKNEVTIYTLPFLVDYYKNEIEKGTYSGYKGMDESSIMNQKAILDGMLVLKTENEKYGVVNSRYR